MNPETRFVKALRPHLPGHVMRVENPADPGTPAINGCYAEQEYWIEAKQVKDPTKSPDSHPFRGLLRPAQYLWLRKRSKQNSRIRVFVAFPKHYYSFPPSVDLEAMTLAEAEVYKVLSLEELVRTLNLKYKPTE